MCFIRLFAALYILFRLIFHITSKFTIQCENKWDIALLIGPVLKIETDKLDEPWAPSDMTAEIFSFLRFIFSSLFYRKTA